MDIQKERETFEAWFSYNSIRDHMYVRGERMDEKGNYYSEYAYLAWSAWQAAKAQAVLEGFVLVPKEPTEAMYIAGTDKRQSGGNTADVYKAMIEAQEQKG